MKVNKEYEVWVGGDMIDDMLDYNQAIAIVKRELKGELEEPENHRADVVLDEIIHWEVESFEDISKLGE